MGLVIPHGGVNRAGDRTPVMWCCGVQGRAVAKGGVTPLLSTSKYIESKTALCYCLA